MIVAQILRKSLLQKGQATFDVTLEKIGPWSISALLASLVLLFAFQGQAISEQPLVIALLAVPILIQVAFNAGLRAAVFKPFACRFGFEPLTRRLAPRRGKGARPGRLS